MKTALIFFLILFFGCSSGGGGSSDDFFPESGPEDIAVNLPDSFKSWEYFDRSFADADKTGTNDNEMCWAASAANALTWTGWAINENETFAILKEHFKNQKSFVFTAFDFYFKNYVKSISIDQVAIREYFASNQIDFIKSALLNEKAVIVALIHRENNQIHFISIYGYRKLNEFWLLYYADSDDKKYRILSKPFKWRNSQWSSAEFSLKYSISLEKNIF